MLTVLHVWCVRVVGLLRAVVQMLDSFSVFTLHASDVSLDAVFVEHK